VCTIGRPSQVILELRSDLTVVAGSKNRDCSGRILSISTTSSGGMKSTVKYVMSIQEEKQYEYKISWLSELTFRKLREVQGCSL
jgi:hypothetical protein